MEEYKNYLDAIAILSKARHEVMLEVGSAFNNSAWDKLFHASQYLAKQVVL